MWRLFMQGHTRKHPTDDGLVSLQFRVHPANVERIKRYVETVEPCDEGAAVRGENHLRGISQTAPLRQYV